MQRHGWTLLFHDCVAQQLQKLSAAADRAKQTDPDGFEGNANVKLFRGLSQLILDVVPSDPARDEYRQGNTLGAAYRHWRRAKVGKRFCLFFRYDSKARVIVFAGSTTNGRCGRLAASPTRMRCSRRCSDEGIRLMTGQRSSPPVERIGPRRIPLVENR